MVDSKGMVEVEDVKSFIKPLNGKDDFTLWWRRMKSVLILQDLYEAVLGIENKAVDMADKVWQKMDKKARSTIELHLADHVLGRVLDSGGDNMSSKETWDYLEKVYAGKGPIGENMDNNKTLDNVKDYLYQLHTSNSSPHSFPVRILSSTMRLPKLFNLILRRVARPRALKEAFKSRARRQVS